MRKAYLSVALWCVAIVCAMAAPPTNTVYRGTVSLASLGDDIRIYNDTDSGSMVVATPTDQLLMTVGTSGAPGLGEVWALGGFRAGSSGQFYGNGAGLTNLAASSGLWLTVQDDRAVTNLAGDLSLEATSTFLQMNATGSATGFQYYDFYNGGSEFILRRKADGGGSVLANIFTLANDVWTFGVPVVVTGTFTGDGAGLTNLPVQTYSVNATNWLGVGSSNAYTGTFTGDGTGLTNVTAVSTNNEALFATNAPDGKAIASQDWVTNTASAILDGLYISTTNGSASSSLVVNGNTQWGIQFAVRGQASQTNDILQVQNATTDLIWGVGPQGHLSWGNAPTNAGTTNVLLYLVITNNGVGYGIPLHELQ